MNMNDVREYESKLQKETNSLMEQNIPLEDPSSAGSGDAPDNLSLQDTPRTPNSPAKKGYFSNWF